MRTLAQKALLVSLFLAGSAAAQQPGPYEPIRRDSLGTRLINSATPYPVGNHRLEVLFTHPFRQLLLARRLARGVNLLVSPSWVADTPRLADAFNVPIGLTFPLPGERLIELEYVPANRDLDTSNAAWHVAISKALGGHIFEVLVGNSRATTVDQMLGGDSAAGFETSDVRLGFNIVRYFN